MYLVISASSDIKVAYFGGDHTKALEALIQEAGNYISEARGADLDRLPKPKDLENVWSFHDRTIPLHAAINSFSAVVYHGGDRAIVQLKEIQLSRQALQAAAETYESLVRAEVVNDRLTQHGMDKESAQDTYQEALRIYSEALDDGAAEEDALLKLEQFLSAHI